MKFEDYKYYDENVMDIIEDFACLRVEEHEDCKWYNDHEKMEKHYEECWELMIDNLNDLSQCFTNEPPTELPIWDSFYDECIDDFHRDFFRDQIIVKDPFDILKGGDYIYDEICSYEYDFSKVFTDLLEEDYENYIKSNKLLVSPYDENNKIFFKSNKLLVL